MGKIIGIDLGTYGGIHMIHYGCPAISLPSGRWNREDILKTALS